MKPPSEVFAPNSSLSFFSDIDDEFRSTNNIHIRLLDEEFRSNRIMNNDRGNNNTKRGEDYFSSSSDSSIDSNGSSALPPARKKSRANDDAAAKHPKKNATAASHLLKKYRGGKENQVPQVGKNKKGRSKSLNNFNASPAFGQGIYRQQRRAFTYSPAGKPMILSRRLSYKINNSTTPDKSPVVATKLEFTPVARRKSKGRRSRHHESSLERLGASKRSMAAKKARKSKRNSI